MDWWPNAGCCYPIRLKPRGETRFPAADKAWKTNPFQRRVFCTVCNEDKSGSKSNSGSKSRTGTKLDSASRSGTKTGTKELGRKHLLSIALISVLCLHCFARSICSVSPHIDPHCFWVNLLISKPWEPSTSPWRRRRLGRRLPQPRRRLPRLLEVQSFESGMKWWSEEL